MSVLAIDIGNTRVGLNVYTTGKAQDAATRLTHDQLDTDLPATLRVLWDKAEAETKTNDDDETAIVIASVVPAITEKIQRLILAATGETAQLIGRDFHIPVKTKLRDETTVGQDRLLAALATYVNVETAAVIVHLGTALVVDCIDGEGIFQGGAIAPGLQMAARSLHDHTAQLPDASLTPPTDDVPFGRFTQEAINLGVYIGMRGAVRELIERYASALNQWPHVVATGGDAQAVLGDSDLIQSFVPDLVLQGIALAWEHNRSE